MEKIEALFFFSTETLHSSADEMNDEGEGREDVK